MPLELLIQAGLTPTQAEILGFLLSQNELKAKELVDALKKPRGVVYKGLEELEGLGLVERIEKTGTVARFRAEHPSKLESLFEAKEKNAQRERQNFLQNLPELTSHYNLVHRKPGMHFYEGELGRQQVLNDTLRAQTELLIFLNKEDVLTVLDEEYQKQCAKVGIRQRVIVAAERPLEKSSSDQRLEIRYLGQGLTPFKSSVKIYDKKIAYQTIENGQVMSVLIEDQNISETNRVWFEFLWQQAK